jgi:hypothetical protein
MDIPQATDAAVNEVQAEDGAVASLNQIEIEESLEV